MDRQNNGRTIEEDDYRQNTTLRSSVQRDWDICIQPLRYAYFAQMHRATNLHFYSLAPSPQLSAPNTLGCPTLLPSETTATTFPELLRAGLLHGEATSGQDGDRRVKLSKWKYKNDHDLRSRNAPLSFTVGHYIYLNRPRWLHRPLNVWQLSCTTSWWPPRQHCLK